MNRREEVPVDAGIHVGFARAVVHQEARVKSASLDAAHQRSEIEADYLQSLKRGAGEIDLVG